MTNINDDLIPAFVATIYLAGTIVPLHSMLSPKEILNILEKTKPPVMFCDADSYSILRGILKSITWNMDVFTFGEQRIEHLEPFKNLLIETDEESNFR